MTRAPALALSITLPFLLSACSGAIAPGGDTSNDAAAGHDSSGVGDASHASDASTGGGEPDASASDAEAPFDGGAFDAGLLDASDDGAAPDAACTPCGNACVDVTVDTHHCGVCGHDCLGGACGGGRCEPTTLASGRNGPLDLAIDDASVYWSENQIGTIAKVAKSGGTVRPLVTGNSVWFVATDGVHVFWTDRTNGHIGWVPVGGGTASFLATDSSGAGPYGITTDGGFVYWTNFSTGKLFKVDVGGSHVVTPLGSSSGPTGIAARSGTVYWTQYASVVNRADALDGSNAKALTSAANVDSRFAATDGSYVYFTMSDGGSVWAVDAVNGGAAIPISTVEAEPWGITVDASGVYWVNKNPSGAQANSVRHAVLGQSGWTTETLAGGQSGASSIATDATAIYWTTFAGGTVMRLAK